MRPVLSVVLLASCASSFDDLPRRVSARIQHEVPWPPSEDTAAASELLSKPLSVESAVKIALATSPTLKAKLERVGVASAALLDVSLPSNPSIHGDVRFEQGKDRPFLEGAIVESLTDWLYLPSRSQIGSAELEAAKHDAVGDVLELAFEVRVAFHRCQAAEQRLATAVRIRDLAAASFLLATKLHEAGNIRDLDYQNELALLEGMKLAVVDEEIAALDARERLNVLLGLHGESTGWKIDGSLPSPEPAEPKIEDVERRAIEASVELLSQRERMRAVAARAGLARVEGILPEVEIGVAVERDERWQVGPSFGITIPVFDLGQAEVARNEAELRRMKHEYAAAAVRIRSDVRSAQNRLIAARQKAVHFGEVLVPLFGRIVDESQGQYNAMGISVFQLIAAKQRHFEVERKYVDALLGYSVAKARLDQILAGARAGMMTAAAGDVPARDEGGH